MQEHKNLMLALILIFFLGFSAIIFTLKSIGNKGYETRYSLTVYESWCKLEQRNDITYEEWKNLNRAGLLQHK